MRSKRSLPSKLPSKPSTVSRMRGSKAAYGARGKPVGHQGSDLRVFRRVQVQHAHLRDVTEVPSLIPEPAVVPQHQVDVSIFGQHPSVLQAHPVNGVFTPQLLIDGVRVCAQLLGKWVIRGHPTQTAPRPVGPAWPGAAQSFPRGLANNSTQSLSLRQFGAGV